MLVYGMNNITDHRFCHLSNLLMTSSQQQLHFFISFFVLSGINLDGTQFICDLHFSAFLSFFTNLQIKIAD